jgi:ABC-type branched-subunit amino acid transport system substrate-binding protein
VLFAQTVHPENRFVRFIRSRSSPKRCWRAQNALIVTFLNNVERQSKELDISFGTAKQTDIAAKPHVDRLGSFMNNLERSDKVIKPDYASRGSSEFYRHGKGGAAEDEESFPRGDLSRLRQSLGPEPEVVHLPQPTRRVGWFVSGFIIASALGIVIGAAVIIAFPSISGKTPGSSAKPNEFASRFDNPKSSPEVNAPAPGVPAAAPGPRAIQPSSPIASAPIAPTGPQSAGSAPARVATAGAPSEPAPTVRGVTDSEIRFGISAPFTGPAKELGQNMKLGIEAAFALANANGGINGRQLRLVAVDDGYEPARTAATMKQLFEKDQVFALIGNVGTPTAAVALPYALDRKMLFFGAFTGAGLLRNDPPDRYVFNYRASYAEETAAVVNYLVKVKRLAPEQIAVFAQQDAYGDAGFAGVEKAIRSLRGGNDSPIVRLNYQRNTVDVDDAVAQLQQIQQQKNRLPIKAVIMVPTYRAAAKFIEKTRDLYPDMIYTSVSFVGATALANELLLLGKKFAAGVIVTQVVPAVEGHSSLVLDYESALAKYFPGEAADYVSLEGYVDATVLIAALQRNGPQLDTEKLVATLENFRDLDIGLGTPVTFSRSEHQGVHKVWGTQLDADGRYQPIDLQ